MSGGRNACRPCIGREAFEAWVAGILGHFPPLFSILAGEYGGGLQFDGGDEIPALHDQAEGLLLFIRRCLGPQRYYSVVLSRSPQPEEIENPALDSAVRTYNLGRLIVRTCFHSLPFPTCFLLSLVFC